jgi:hypothetical protein
VAQEGRWVDSTPGEEAGYLQVQPTVTPSVKAVCEIGTTYRLASLDSGKVNNSLRSDGLMLWGLLGTV